MVWLKQEVQRLDLKPCGPGHTKASWRIALKIYMGVADAEVNCYRNGKQNKRKSDKQSAKPKDEDKLEPTDKYKKKD